MTPRTLPWDWHPGSIPDNVRIDDTAYVETSFSFLLSRSDRPEAVRYGRGASSYLGTMFDLGPRGRVTIGDYSLLHGVRVICDDSVVIGDYALISWNVVIMDTYRFSASPEVRRRELEHIPPGRPRVLRGAAAARPVTIGSNVWIGFDAVVMPGVTVGDGSIVGARSVVTEDVPPYTAVAGNPARVIRTLDPDGGRDGGSA